MLKYSRSNRTSKIVEWRRAPDIRKRVITLVNDLNLDWLKTSKLYFFRSFSSKTRARARIWGLSRIWQMALTVKPAYIIEVVSEKFDHLSLKEQDQILLHELAHIPKNFSGSLLPHIRYGKRSFNDRVNELIAKYLRNN